MRASFERLTTDLDVRPLLRSIESQPNLWREITARQDTPGSPHADTQAIFLRGPREQTLRAMFDDVEAIDYPALEKLPEARELIAACVAKAAGTKLARVIIAPLKPGGRVTPHADEGAYADTYERFHLVLQGDYGNMFHVDEPSDSFYWQTVMMRPGELWWFNHKRTHWVENRSMRERIHLIVDMSAPNYFVERGQ